MGPAANFETLAGIIIVVNFAKKNIANLTFEIGYLTAALSLREHFQPVERLATKAAEALAERGTTLQVAFSLLG